MASFKEAFREARASGDKKFEWNGKSYTTDLASDTSPAPSKSVSRSSPSNDYPSDSNGNRTRGPGASDPTSVRDPRISTLTTRRGPQPMDPGIGYNEGSSVRDASGNLRRGGMQE